MRYSIFLIFSILFEVISSVQFPPQLSGNLNVFSIFLDYTLGLLPDKIENLYRQLDRQELLFIDQTFLALHDSFYEQVKQLGETDRKLSKRFFFAFTKLYRQSPSFSKELKFFYFWRVNWFFETTMSFKIIHVINDLLIHDVTEANLNKFAADIVIEWELLSASDQKYFNLLYPSIVKRIKGEFILC